MLWVKLTHKDKPRVDADYRIFILIMCDFEIAGTVKKDYLICLYFALFLAALWRK